MISTPLMPHQIEAVEKLKSIKFSGLFVSVGLGKSLTALALAEAHGASTVIITSDLLNTLNTWPDQLSRHTNWTYAVRPKSLMGHTGTKERPHAVIVNYDQLSIKKLLYKQYRNHPFNFWIGDESAEFKDCRRHRHKALRSMVYMRMPCTILNAKLMTEHLTDVYGQCFFLLNGKLGNYTEFRNRYMQLSSDGFGWVARRNAFTMLQTYLQSCSYWNDGNEVNMPDVNYITVNVPMTDEQKHLDRALKETFAAELRGVRVELEFAGAVFQKRIQLCGGIFRHDNGYEFVNTNKLAIVRRIVNDNPEDRIVIWHTYIPETELLAKFLQKYKPIIISDSKQTDDLNAFAENKTSRIALCRTSICKGINQFVGARIAIIYSNPLSYARRAQLEGRTCRMTSEHNAVTYIDILCDGGADAIVAALLGHKKDCAMTLGGLRKILNNMSKKEEIM